MASPPVQLQKRALSLNTIPRRHPTEAYLPCLVALPSTSLAHEAEIVQEASSVIPVSSRYSFSDNCNDAACMFSSRCAIEEVPGMGSIIGDRFSRSEERRVGKECR